MAQNLDGFQVTAARKSECPLAGGHHADNQSSDDPDSATDERQRKALSTVTAQLALQGHAVHVGSNGDYLVSRWNMSRYCQDFAALQDFARRLGVIE